MTSPILAVIDRMMAEPAPERPASETAAARPMPVASPPPAPAPLLAPKGIQVDRSPGVKDSLDEAAELFKTIFKGDIVP